MHSDQSDFQNSEILFREQRELFNYWGKLFDEGQCKVDFHARAPVARLFSPSRGSRDDVRKLHDVFGWCAKRPVLCAGAIYRSRAFMELDPAKRDASKPRGRTWPRNMHIEHTILSSQLHDMWLARPVDTHASLTFFLSHGMATAMHVIEERSLGGDYRTPNPCHADGLGLPFLRYAGKLPAGSSIWNVVNGQQVDLRTFTLADHRQAVRALLARVAAPPAWISDIPA